MNRLWGLLLSTAMIAAAQETPIKVDVDVVNVLCTVYDKRGALVQDLQKADFEIRENGKLQEIRYFARDTDLPLTVALLVDVSGSVGRFIAEEKDAACEVSRDRSAAHRPCHAAGLFEHHDSLAGFHVVAGIAA